MIAKIEVKDRLEAKMLREGLRDPVTRALVVTVGALKPFSPRERQRMLNFVADKLSEQDLLRT